MLSNIVPHLNRTWQHRRRELQEIKARKFSKFLYDILRPLINPAEVKEQLTNKISYSEKHELTMRLWSFKSVDYSELPEHRYTWFNPVKSGMIKIFKQMQNSGCETVIYDNYDYMLIYDIIKHTNILKMLAFELGENWDVFCTPRKLVQTLNINNKKVYVYESQIMLKFMPS